MEKNLVIVTGASSGLGAATATLFKENGYPVLALARRVEKLEPLNGDQVLCKKCDVSNLQEFRACFDEAVERFGPADCIVNNAGLLYLGLFAEQDPKEWKSTFDVNLLGVAHGMHLVLPNMIKSKTGTIFNVSSVGGHASYATQAAYCATKFGIIAMTDSVRLEVSKYNIRLMIVTPGAVETEVGKETTKEKIKKKFDEMRQAVSPLDPEVIAKAILHAHEQPQNVSFREMIITPTPTVSEE